MKKKKKSIRSKLLYFVLIPLVILAAAFLYIFLNIDLTPKQPVGTARYSEWLQTGLSCENPGHNVETGDTTLRYSSISSIDGQNTTLFEQTETIPSEHLGYFETRYKHVYTEKNIPYLEKPYYKWEPVPQEEVRFVTRKITH